MAEQVRDGLHRHIPAHHLGREGVPEDVGARPRDGDAGATQRSLGDVRHGRTAELPIWRPRGYEDHIRGTGRGPRAQRGHQGRPNVGRQWQLSLPSSFTGHTDSPVVPVDVLHREGCGLCCPEAEPAQEQQDGAVTTAVGACLVHRGQHPRHVGIGDGAGQSGVLPFADGRHGAFDAGANHTAGGKEA